jgi:hypothetical protein
MSELRGLGSGEGLCLQCLKKHLIELSLIPNYLTELSLIPNYQRQFWDFHWHRNAFPLSPGINTCKVKDQFINLSTCLFVWMYRCSIVKAI